MTSKNETGAFIRYFGNAKSQLTEGENIVRGILKDLGYGFRIQEKIPLYTVEDGLLDSITFTIDLFIPEHKMCVEVDGIHHRTARQERKTAWRDARLIANGYKVLHIDSQYTETKELQAELKPMIQKAIKDLLGGKQTVRIVA